MPDLMLSGHTHGGQFNLLGVTPYTFGFERLFARRRSSRFIAGLHEYRGAQMLVSKGIGMSRIPLRIGVRSEIHRIDFC
jgi:predicted MPP superfamily phosphohydrolase